MLNPVEEAVVLRILKDLILEAIVQLEEHQKSQMNQ